MLHSARFLLLIQALIRAAAAAPAAPVPKSPATPIRVAVVGAGPAGLFVSQELLAQKNIPVKVDLFDRLPAPYGLVRNGVAPDHQGARGWIDQLARIIAHPSLRFFGNVRVGTDLSPEDLSRFYDKVVYAVGSEGEKTLGIPGEDLDGVHGVGSFVGWYNAHPDHAHKSFDLSGRNAVVIGMGPVALDAARVLAHNPKNLAHTDISERALATLQQSGIKTIHMLGRRGPEGATFSLADIKEVGSLNSADLVVRRQDLSAADITDPKTSYLREVARHGEGSKPRKVRLRFYSEPQEILGDQGRVVGVSVKTADGKSGMIPADIVVRAIGYRGIALPGVPFDEKRGVIPNENGRVLDPETGLPMPNTYVAGWAKNGASSLIGMQRADAQATVASLLEDAAKSRSAPANGGTLAKAITDFLKERRIPFVDYSSWQILDALERKAGESRDKTREKFHSTRAMISALNAEMPGTLTEAPTPRSTQGPLYVEVKGVRHPLGYNPELGVRPLWKDAWDWIRHFPSKIAAVRAYMRRVREQLEDITDDDLRWSIDRFALLENQEGILRQGNRELVNDWRPWTAPNLRNVGPDDFRGSLLSPVSLRKIFKQAMDREEPTRAYQFTAAMNLHNLTPRVAHFMGVTMQERIIAIALKGEAPQHSVWAVEEERHGDIMESVYNASRQPGQPELHQQGIAPTSPKPGEYSARSMIANRSYAEIGAASGYLVLKSNAREGSPADLALEGIFRDEVYHYVLMNAARKWGFGLRGRWARIANIIRHNFDNPLPQATDTTVFERPGFSPMVVFQVAYAFYQIDKRVDRFLRAIPDEEGRRLVGKVYRNEAEVLAAIDRGEHTWTDPFPMEVNPEISFNDLANLVRRFPGRFSFDRRSLKASQIREILARYRESLRTPSYWLRRKGFSVASETATDILSLERSTGVGESAVDFTLLFPKAGSGPDAPKPTIAIRADGKKRVIYEGPLDQLSLRQFGAIFSAEDARDLENFDGLRKDYTPQEIANRFINNADYAKNPIPVIEDSPAEIAAMNYKTYMCLSCGYKYSEKDGDPKSGIAPGTRWEDVPADWVCPECGETKASFQEDMVEVVGE